MNSEYVLRARNWLIDRQNTDGGWGEHYISSFREDLAGIGYSTPIQTGWALEGLLSLPEPPIDCVKKGIKFLMDMQLPGGGWHTDVYSATGIEVYKNSNYDVWALMALGLYKKRYPQNEGDVNK